MRQPFSLALVAGPALRDPDAEAVLRDPDRLFPADVSVDEFFPVTGSIGIFDEDGTKSL